MQQSTAPSASAPASTLSEDARAGLEEVSEALGIDLGAEGVADEVDTLGGLIVTLVGRVPPRGELIAGPEKLEFEILDADPRRLKKLRIHRRPTAEAAAAALTNPEVPPAAGPVPFQSRHESRPGSAAAE